MYQYDCFTCTPLWLAPCRGRGVCVSLNFHVPGRATQTGPLLVRDQTNCFFPF